MRSCLVVLPGPAGAKSDGKNWHRKQEFPASTPGFPDHGRTKAANQWRIEKPQALRRVCFQLMGEATTAFQKPLRIIWSRRRQSTAVNGACQARTTTCCILDEIGGIKDHNSRICLWRMAERCVIRGFALCRGDQGAALHASPRPDLGTKECATNERTRPLRGPQGVEMVQFRWSGVGVVDKPSPADPPPPNCNADCASWSIV